MPTWHDGVLLTREEKARLSPEELDRYLADSVVRDLSEIGQMPEPMRSWAHAVVERARRHKSGLFLLWGAAVHVPADVAVPGGTMGR